jgi:alpha-ketoglutarate-dependent taurine dioxygenase
VTETLTSHFKVRRASPLIGAEIEGVDLTQPVDEGTAQALREAFWTCKVLVFRGQSLSPLQHVEAIRIFDEPFDHPKWVHRQAPARRRGWRPARGQRQRPGQDLGSLHSSTFFSYLQETSATSARPASSRPFMEAPQQRDRRPARRQP